MFHITTPRVGFFENNTIVLNKKLAFNIGLSAPTSETDQLILYGDYFRQYDDHFKPVGINTSQFGVMYSHDLYAVDDDRTSFTFGIYIV